MQRLCLCHQKLFQSFSIVSLSPFSGWSLNFKEYFGAWCLIKASPSPWNPKKIKKFRGKRAETLIPISSRAFPRNVWIPVENSGRVPIPESLFQLPRALEWVLPVWNSQDSQNFQDSSLWKHRGAGLGSVLPWISIPAGIPPPGIPFPRNSGLKKRFQGYFPAVFMDL